MSITPSAFELWRCWLETRGHYVQLVSGVPYYRTVGLTKARAHLVGRPNFITPDPTAQSIVLNSWLQLPGDFRSFCCSVTRQCAARIVGSRNVRHDRECRPAGRDLFRHSAAAVTFITAWHWRGGQLHLGNMQAWILMLRAVRLTK